MKLLSLNVSRPRTVTWRGKEISTGIFKESVAGAVMMRRWNLALPQRFFFDTMAV
jgi:MOSC domain-containing protein YiiM